MKGKVKLSFKIVLLVVAVLTMGICFGAIAKPKQQYNRVMAASETIDGKKYSAKFDGDVIFSVEKVGVDKDKNYSNSLYETNVSAMSEQEKESAKYTTFYGRIGDDHNVAYNFKDLANGTDSKYVVADGEFVMLNKTNEVAYEEDGSIVSLEEAVMVSFGQYIYSKENDSEKITVANSNSSAGLTVLNISLLVNGNRKTNLPANRNVPTADGFALDFVYLLTKDNCEEGMYEFTINYMKDKQAYTKNFAFYILFESSYTGANLDAETNQEYTAFPTLGWTNSDGEFVSQSGDSTTYIHYNMSVDGVTNNSTSYPTLTYDYTRYKLSYTLTANNKITNYDYAYRISYGEAKMDITLTGAENRTYTENLVKYGKDNNNLASIVLTEGGYYLFHFEYIYTGYVNSSIPVEINLTISDKSLAIHGYVTKYSKLGYNEAQLRYLNLSNGNDVNVDVIVPNGLKYDENTKTINRAQEFKNGSLPLLYSVKSSNARLGAVLNDGNTLDTMLVAKQNEIENIVSEINAGSEISENITDWLNNVNYIKSNQGSMWLTTASDTYNTDSFYVYNTNKIDKTNIVNSIHNYTPQTSFNKTGYYLVFMKVSPVNSSPFWQVFAFQYSTSTTNINTYAVNGYQANGTPILGDVVDKNGYTNKDVYVSWEEPGIFDKSLTAFYYTKNQNVDEKELTTGTKTNLTNGGIIPQVSSGFAKHLIRIESEGESATSKVFTCDKQPISNIGSYVVEQRTANGSTYYAYKVDNNGNKILIQNYITDSFASLYWDEKESGAGITVEYTFTPFSKSNDDVEKILYQDGNYWLTTNYTLGTTLGTYEITTRPQIQNINYSSVFTSQGIYLFKLTDKAGNISTHVLIIDKTPAYFEVPNNSSNFYTGKSLIFNQEVTLNAYKYKAI